jgi:hypothetical protein
MTRKRFTTDATPKEIVDIAHDRAPSMGYLVKQVSESRLRIQVGNFWLGLLSRGRVEYSVFRLEAKAFDDGNDLMLEWYPTSLSALLRQNMRSNDLLKGFAADLAHSGYEVMEIEEY